MVSYNQDNHFFKDIDTMQKLIKIASIFFVIICFGELSGAANPATPKSLSEIVPTIECSQQSIMKSRAAEHMLIVSVACGKNISSELLEEYANFMIDRFLVNASVSSAKNEPKIASSGPVIDLLSIVMILNNNDLHVEVEQTSDKEKISRKNKFDLMLLDASALAIHASKKYPHHYMVYKTQVDLLKSGKYLNTIPEFGLDASRPEIRLTINKQRWQSYCASPSAGVKSNSSCIIL